MTGRGLRHEYFFNEDIAVNANGKKEEGWVGDKGAQASGILSQVRVIRCFSENTKIHKFDMAVPCQ